MRAQPVDLLEGRRAYLGESPRWDGGAWWWVDAAVGEVWTREPGDEARCVWRTGARVSLVHPEISDRVVIADGTELHVLAKASDGSWHSVGRWCDLDVGDGWLVNDGVADARGRLWIGSVAPGRQRYGGTLLRVEPDGHVAEAATGLTLTNGMAWDIDGVRLLHADTFERVVLAHQVDVESGMVLGSDELIAFDADDGMPDGIATDVEGGVWVAMYGSGETRRYTADGGLDLVIEVDAPQCTSVELGGADGRDVLITTAREGYDGDRSARESGAGRLYCARSPYPGLAKPKAVVNREVDQ